MKAIYSILIITLLLFLDCPAFLEAQSITIGEPNPKNFPQIEAPFIVKNIQGQILEGVQSTDFNIWENSYKIPASSITVDCDEEKAPMQILLVFDQSTSMGEMVDGETKMYWAKRCARAFINDIVFDEYIEIAVLAFCSGNTLYCDFTNDKTKLLDAIDAISVIQSITDFNEAFLNTTNGAIELLRKKPNFNRTIIFMTDGAHSSSRGDFKHTDVSDNLKKNDVTLYVLTINTDFSTSLALLQNISILSGGEVYSGLRPDQIVEIYKKLAYNLPKRYNCFLYWKSTLYCDSIPRETKVVIRYNPLNKQINTFYTAPDWSIFEINSIKTMNFGNVPPGTYSDTVIKIQTQPFDWVINNISILDKTYFSIVDWGDGTGIPRSNFSVKSGDELNITLRFSQNNNTMPRFTKLFIDAYPCDNTINIFGGNMVVEIIKPIINSKFNGCNAVDVEWVGVPENTPKSLYYQVDNKTWILIKDKIFSNKYSWVPPKNDGEYKLKVVAYPFAGSAISIEDVSEKFSISFPILSTKINEINFGTVSTGDKKLVSLKNVIFNKKELPYIIDSIAITGEAEDDYILKNSIPSIMNIEDSADIEIEFEPLQSGSRLAQLKIYPKCGSEVIIPLIGEGLCEIIAIDTVIIENSIINIKNDTLINNVIYNPTHQYLRFKMYISGANKNYFSLVDYSGEEIEIAPRSYFSQKIAITAPSKGIKYGILNYSVNNCKSNMTILVADVSYLKMKIDSLNFGTIRQNTNIKTKELNLVNYDDLTKNLVSIKLMDSKYDATFLFSDIKLPFQVSKKATLKLPVKFNSSVIDTFDTYAVFTFDNGDTLYSRLQAITYLPELKMEVLCDSKTNIGDTSIATILLINKSKNSKLIVNSHDILIGDKEFQFITKISDYSIIPADTLIVELEYTPKANMDHYASIVFLADNYDGSFSYYWKENTVEIFCDAQSFETIDPVFETKLLCEESESSFDIINKSKTQELTLYFDKISIIGTDKDYFHFKNDSPEAISPTLKKSYNVVFSGSETRLYSAQAIIPTSTGIDAKIELKASSLKIDFFAKPEIKIFETGKYFVADFYVNIPNVTPKFIDTLSLKLIYNSDVINIQLKDIIFELATNKDFNFNVNEQTNSDTLQIGLSGDMEVNKEYKVFSIKCLGLYTDIDTSLFKGSVVYPCVEDTSNLILLQREKICYDEARRIKISSKVTSPISVNPNPSNGFIELTFESAFDKIIDIDIYNSENRNVKNIRNFQAIKGANRVSVNVSDLPSGSYLLMVKDYKNIDQFKIIIE